MDICAYIFALMEFSGHVGYISLDATFLMYSVNGTLTFFADDAGLPRCTVIKSGITGVANKIPSSQ